MLRIVPHIPQLHDWDCGIAAVCMVLNGLGLCNEERKTAELYQLVHPIQSIWTIDLAYCLRQFGVQDFTMFTTYIGVNWNHVSNSKSGFYQKDPIIQDLRRVHSLFARAQSAQVRVVPFLLSLDDIQRFLLSRRYAVILLVDLNKLTCLQCDSPFLASNINLSFPVKNKMSKRRKPSNDLISSHTPNSVRHGVKELHPQLSALKAGQNDANTKPNLDMNQKWIPELLNSVYTRLISGVPSRYSRKSEKSKGKERKHSVNLESEEIEPLLTFEGSGIDDQVISGPESHNSSPSSSRSVSQQADPNDNAPIFKNLPYFGSFSQSKPSMEVSNANLLNQSPNEAEVDEISTGHGCDASSKYPTTTTSQQHRSVSPLIMQPIIQLFSNVTPPRTPLRTHQRTSSSKEEPLSTATPERPTWHPSQTESCPVKGSPLAFQHPRIASAAETSSFSEDHIHSSMEPGANIPSSPIYPTPRHPASPVLKDAVSPRREYSTRIDSRVEIPSSPTSRQSSLPESSLPIFDAQKVRVSSESDTLLLPQSRKLVSTYASPSSSSPPVRSASSSNVAPEDRSSCTPCTSLSNFFVRVCGTRTTDIEVRKSKHRPAQTSMSDYTVKLAKNPLPKANSHDSEFVGHYIVLIGYDPKRDVYYYRDPGTNESLCLISSRVLESARSSSGTDHDAIVVKIL